MLWVVTAVAALVMPSSASALCGDSTLLRDYLAGVKKAAPVREVPASGQVPFAAGNLHLEAVESGLATAGARIGFRLSNRSTSPRRLNLKIESELLKVTRSGRVIARLGVNRREVGSIPGRTDTNLLHRVSADPAYYRVDVRFFGSDKNRSIAAYSSYTRVVRPRVDLRVRIETPSLEPGEVARATLLNLGTVPLVTPSYDFGFGVQAFSGESWVRVPDNPPKLVPKRGGSWMLSAGMENRGCLRYLVPAGQAPGPFRFAAFGVPGAQPLLAEFQVLAPQ